MAQLYGRVCESEENYEKVKSENEELRQKNITLTKANELILKRVEDIEKETNVMQDKLFDGELGTRGDNQTTDRKLPALQQQQQLQLDAQESSQHDQTNKVFREIKPVGDKIIFGDSNTRGLDRKRLAMGIGSLSGATPDSAITYLENEPTPSEAVKRVIYHLCTNNMSGRRRKRPMFFHTRQIALQQTWSWTFGCNHQEMGERKRAHTRGTSRKPKTTPLSGHPATQKRTQCTVEASRSIAAVTQSTAGKPWQTLRSCKPYNFLL